MNTEVDNLLRGVATAYLANGSIHKRCMKETRISALEQIEKWRSDPHTPQTLWLADVAGAGKSTVAKEVAEKWKSQGILAGRFFFSRDAEETRTPKLFFSTIAQQGLAHLCPEVRVAVAVGIRKLINPVSATLEEQCSSIFVGPLQAIPTPTLLVLDALDECEPGTCQQLLNVLLPQLSNLPHLKLMITSRPEIHIQAELRHITYQELSLRSDEVSNSRDVEVFMRERLRRASLPEAQITPLIERAGGLFIWAKTVCDLLGDFRGNRSSFLDRILSHKLRQMDSVYQIALDQVIRKDREAESMEAYMNVLGVVVAAYEPLSPKTIDKILKISETMDIIHDLRSVLQCGGKNAVIRFLHPTFREFLLNQGASGRYYVDINKAHTHLARGCLSIMDEELDYDICKLYDIQELENEIKFKPEELSEKCSQRVSGALQYSCGFWANHVPADGTSSVLTSIIEEFFAYKLLDWIYVVGVQGFIDKAQTMLRKLILIEFVSDSPFGWLLY
jgi:hypothetical protein